MAINWERRGYTEDEFRDAWANSESVSEVCRKLGKSTKSGNASFLKTTANKLGLSTDHMLGSGWSRGQKRARRPLEVILTKDSEYSSHYLRIRLIAEGVLEERCSICGLSEWLGKPIPLELDHINGDHSDNRIENLRILCRNCHGQQSTHCLGTRSSKTRERRIHREAIEAARQKEWDKLHETHDNSLCPICMTSFIGRNQKCVVCFRDELYLCPVCGEQNMLYGSSKMCTKCKSKLAQKIVWPETDTLRKMVADSSYSEVARRLGVSDNAVRKHLK